MFLNQGKFRQNGGCGYVLKPKVMRNPTGTGKGIVSYFCLNEAACSSYFCVCILLIYQQIHLV